MENIDVLYVLGSGSIWNNNEIRFSLRSLQKNLSGYRNIFIAGAETPFLQNVINIPCDDPFPPQLNADGNIIAKVLKACGDPRLSDNFLFINDDHILLRPLECNSIAPFHKGEMQNYPPDFWQLNPWRKRLHRTMRTLLEKGFSSFNYDCHAPIVFNKLSFQEVMKQFDYSSGIGLTIKNLYGNCVHGPAGRLLSGQKQTVFSRYTTQQLKDRLANCQFLSFNDSGINDPLILYLLKQFPVQSSYEAFPITDRTIEISQWLESDRDFLKGVELFSKYFHGKNLLKMFSAGKTTSLQAKLEYKLEHSLNEI